MSEIQTGRLSALIAKPTLPLGFGCGLLPTSRDRAASIRLLASAADLGVTYFDTARLYAEGQAEGMLGEALGRRRDRIIIASKMGILPTDRSLARRVAEKAGALLRKPLPPASPRFGVFDLPSLRASLETSLRELRTDYLDVLLLHECSPANAANPEIQAFLGQLRKEGKIRAHGVAPTVDAMLAIAQAGTRAGEIAQFANSLWQDTISLLQPQSEQITITHSCLGAPFRDIWQRLKTDDAAAARWLDLTGVDPRDGASLAQLFLAHAIRRNSDGLVLFSSTDPARLAANLRAADPELFDAGQLAALPAAVAAIGA